MRWFQVLWPDMRTNSCRLGQTNHCCSKRAEMKLLVLVKLLCAILPMTLHARPIPEGATANHTTSGIHGGMAQHVTCEGTFNKIFVVGFPKSGTLSLHTALLSGGINSTHWTIDAHGKRKFVGTLMLQALLEGRKLLDYIPSEVQAFTQMDVLIGCKQSKMCEHNAWPQLILVPVLDLQYPNSKFIYNWRPAAHTIQSMQGWGDMVQRIGSNPVPFLPQGKGLEFEELRKWIDRQEETMVAYFEDRPCDFLHLDIEMEGAAVQKKLQVFLQNPDIQWQHKHKSSSKNHP